MGWRDSDAVTQTMTGEDGSGSGIASGWDGGLSAALARLSKRNPMAGSILGKAVRSSKSLSPADPDLASSIGAGDAGSGPNGPGISNPRQAAKPINVNPESDYSSSNEADFQPYDVGAPELSADELKASRMQTDLDNRSIKNIASAPPDQQPRLAPQGGSNRFVRALARLSGLAGQTPDSGQPYVGPGSGFTVDADSGNIRKQTYAERVSQPSPLSLLGRALQQVGASVGTPQEKLWALEQPQQEQEMNLRLQMAQNEANYRRGMLGYHDRANDIAESKAQTAHTKTMGDLRSKGYKVDEGGNIAPMSEDEILADPTAAQNQQLRQAAIQSKQAQAALAKAHEDAIANPNSPTFQQKERQIQAQLAMAQQRLELARSGQALGQERFGLTSREEGLKIFQPALDSEERLKVMRQNYVDGLKGDQQAQLSLLANHLGMTMGLQKGARLNQAIISEAQKSRPWLQGLKAKFDSDGYLTGVTLSPQQMQQMVSLGEDRFRADVSKSRRSASMVGLADEPQWEVDPDREPEALPRSLGELGYNAARNAAPRSFVANGNGSASSPGKPLSVDEAGQYLRRAGGDRKKAESMARRDGRTF
jgi:hypothetical protein